MPYNASKSKVDATKSYGGDVVLTRNNMMDVCNEIIDKENLTFIHPFDDHDIIRGQGTLSLEILEEIKNIDYVFISIGGGGLISGMSHVLKLFNPKIKIYGVFRVFINRFIVLDLIGNVGIYKVIFFKK